MIDLSHFVCLEEDRPHLQQPWTRGRFTYATDGRIMVRVPARIDVQENADAPEAERILSKLTFGGNCDRAIPDLPPLRFAQEDVADPWDTGSPVLVMLITTASFQGSVFNLRYLHLLRWLGAKAGRPVDVMSPMPFIFGEGVGALMPTKAMPEVREHIDLDGVRS
ncbi:hypothetical protein [Bosea minatitlanensis]|uniref:Uncharacterized protein n=1 Tax=Bosea minatitlanensis TaxID=128782 RepID=A0ABW0F2M9_9HYPH|nr:hypothetical protein [Bosea minatitlanensis]MCT4492764.1 hypothetical protein [Bosea minatitlanensis]